MKRFPFILAGAVLAAGMLSPAQAPQKSPAGSDEDKQVKAIIAAKQAWQAADGYRELFKSATEDALRRLQMNPSDTIAIQAAWQEVEHTVPEKPAQSVRPDRDKLSWFLGFLEGRGRLQAPKWWADAVLDARANRRGNIYAGGFSMKVRQNQKPKPPEPPDQATFDKQDGKPVVRVGKLSVQVDEDLRNKLKVDKGHSSISALVTPSRCYVAAYEGVGYPYRLACVERSSGKTRWVAEVWASWWGGATGIHHQWVEVTEQGDRVVVFGITSAGFHVEAFRIEDGVNVLRFSNSYSP